MEVNIESAWKNKLTDEFEKLYFQLLVSKVKNAYQNSDVGPKGNNIFKAFDACPFENLKVVILGQDPYPTTGHAHGLCFSVPADVKPIPKSLINIFKEIQADTGTKFPENGNLERWAEQGILLLNTSLTVKAGEPNSHKDFGWEKFTDAVIRTISLNKTGIVFLL